MSGAGPRAPAPSGAGSRPTIRVVVVNWRRPDLTIRACESIRPQLRGGDRLVAVDNASADGSAAALRRAGLDVVETERNLGFGAGVNAGAAGLDEDVLVLLNNDAVAAPGFLDALSAPLGAGGDPSLAATTALILLAGRWRPAGPGEPSLTGLDGGRWTRVPADAEDRGEGEVLVNSTGNLVDSSGNGYDRDWLVRADRLDSPAEVFGLCGGACAIRRGVWEELGGLREDLFMYYEDTELSLRLREAGWTIRYVETALAWHGHSGSSGIESPLFAYCNTRNRLLLARRLPLPVRARAWAKSLVRAALGPQASIRRRAVWDALRGRSGKPGL